MSHHDQPAAMLIEDGRTKFICYERCLYCGRRVALGHQACLRDVAGNGREVAMTEDDEGWKAVDFDLPQEACAWCDTDRDKECPMLLFQWGPAEHSPDADVEAARLVVFELAKRANAQSNTQEGRVSRFSREQLETLTKVFADATTNHVAAAGEVTVRELAQTALDGLDRIAALEKALRFGLVSAEKYLPLIEGRVTAPHGLSSADSRNFIDRATALLNSANTAFRGKAADSEVKE